MRRLLASLSLIALLALPAAAAEVVVDDFVDAQGPISAPPTSTSFQTEVAGIMIPPGAANGERDLRLLLLDAAGTLDSTAEAAGGVLNFSAPEVRSELFVTWDGIDGSDTVDATGLGGVDLTDGGTNNALRLTVDAVSGVAELVVELYTDAANTSRAFATVSAAGDVFFPFGAFTARLGAGADPANVGAITLQIRASAVASLDVSDFRALGPAVESTKVDALLVDGDGDGAADPGDTLRYTIDVTSTGGTATGVEVDDTVGGNLNFVGGSILVSPIAVNDGYATVGNIQLAVTDPLLGLLANDFDPDDGTSSFTVTAFDAVSLQGGAVSVAADGTFAYDAPLGLSGVDSFDYTLTDLDGLSDDGTVSVLIEGTVWFVDDGPGGCGAQPCGSGTQADPFGGFHPTQLNGAGGAGDVDGPGDIIFVFEGSGATDTGDAAGFELEDGQILHGEGVELNLGGITIVPAGNNPILTNTAGTAGHGVALAADNTVRGLTVGATNAGSSAFRATADVGDLTIEDSDVSGAGGIFDVAAGGALSVTFDSLASTASTVTPAINVSGVSGSFTVTNPGAGLDTSIASADAGISIQSSTGASFAFGETSVGTTASGGSGVDLGTSAAATFTFDSLDVTTAAGAALVAANSGTLNVGGTANTIAATGGAGVDVTAMSLGAGVTFDSVTSTASTGRGIRLDSVSGNLTVSGTTTVNTAAAEGIRVASSTGSYSFGGGATVTSTGGNGIDITGSGGTFSFASANVTSAVGAGINLSGANGPVTFSAVDIDGSGGPGIAIVGNTSTVAVNGGTLGASSDNGSAGAAAVDIDGAAASVTILASITNTVDRAVEITNSGVGTIDFAGAVDEDGTGIRLDNNDQGGNATITFRGGLDLDTTVNPAFSATNGGVVEVCATADCAGGAAVVNTSDTGAATGINIQNTTLGASGVTFQSVNVNGATVGIDIDGGGTTGFFTVTGTGTTDGSGGTIQNTAQNGVLIENTDNITLSNMTFLNAAADGGGAGSCDEDDFGGCNAAIELNTVATVDIANASVSASEDHGIFGQTVTDLDISDTDVTGLGADVDSNEHGIFVRNLLGTVSGGTDSVFDNVTIDDSQDTAILVENTTATDPGNGSNPDLLTVTNSALSDSGDTGLRMQTLAAAGNTQLIATGNTVTNTVDGIEVVAEAGDAQATVGGAGALANVISHGGTGDMVNGIRFLAIASLDDATVVGTATNNTITVFAQGSPAPVSGLNGIGLASDGDSAGNLGTLRATVTDNTINSTFAGILTQTVHGVLVNNEGSGTTAQNVITVDNNDITLNPVVGTTTAETVGVGVDGGNTGAGTTVRVDNNVIVATGDASNGASVGIQILPTEVTDPDGTGTRVCVSVTGNDVSTPNNPFAGAFGTTELDVIAAPVRAGSFLDVEDIPLGVRTPAQLKADLEPLNTNTEVGDTTGLIFGVITGVGSCPN